MAKQTKTEKALIDLLGDVATHLRDKIKRGEASHQDIKNALDLLKDNGINCEKESETGDVLKDAADAINNLPFQTELTVETQ